jgi:transcriptional regulator with XRE-family HTH domain
MRLNLAGLRKIKGLTQERLGVLLAEKTGKHVGPTYMQKKIARFEGGSAKPTDKEIEALCDILQVDADALRDSLKDSVQNFGSISSLAERIGSGRALILVCCMCKMEKLSELTDTLVKVIAEKDVMLGLYVPYPSRICLPEHSDNAAILTGLVYLAVRKNIREWYEHSKYLLPAEKKDSIGLFFPSNEFSKSSSLFLPPIPWQSVLTFEQPVLDGPTSSRLETWVHGQRGVICRSVHSTDVLPRDSQVGYWESFFGEIVMDWKENKETLQQGLYWEQIK